MMAKYVVVMMVCFLVLTQDVSASGSKPRRCYPARSESACKVEDAGGKKYACEWRWARGYSQCVRVYKGNGDVDVEGHFVNDLLDDINRILEEW